VVSLGNSLNADGEYSEVHGIFMRFQGAEDPDTLICASDIAKPEHNGERARVVSFDARSGRCCVALGDGKGLSLKAECLTQTGCATAGCE
jgi:hypothetical protein